MSAKLPISVFIIAKNEADRIGRPLKSVRDWVDEVIVIDSGSDDDTVELSRSLGARTGFRAWTGYGEQKVYGESLCRNDWILNIDADEEVTPGLRAEIERLFSDGGPAKDHYRIPVLLKSDFQTRVHRWTVYQRPVRLYRKSLAGFSESTVHDSVIVRSGSVGKLRGVLIHRSFRSVAHHIDKENRYTSAQAEHAFAKGRNIPALRLLIEVPFSFLKAYVIRRQFLNGLDGFVLSYLYAFQRFARLAKIRERFQAGRDRS